MKKLFLLFLFFSIYKLEACNQAHIFKIFPMGMIGDTIVTIDMHISRSGEEGFFIMSGGKELIKSVKIESELKAYDNWAINSYIAKYNKHQQLLALQKVDSTFFTHNYYHKGTEVLYQQALAKIGQQYTELKPFVLSDFCYCDFEDKCKGMKIEGNTLIYRKEKYPIEIIKDTSYYGLSHHYFYEENHLNPFASVRKYTCEDLELVIPHLQIGQLFRKLKHPKVSLQNVANATYEEHIAYHGNGYDVFFITQKKKSK